MGLFDALLSQEGVNLTGGGFVGAPDDKLMETRFDEMGNAYQADVRIPLHEGHTKASSFNIPDNAQGLLQPEMPTESIDLGRQQVVQPSPQMMQPVPQSSFMPGSQESMAQNQQATIAPWSPEQTNYSDARNVMSGYKGGERLAQRDSGTFQDLTPNADPSQAMEMLAMFKKEGKALTDLQFEKAMGSLGMSDVLAENRSQMNNFDESLNRLVNDNTNDFGEQVSADSFGQSDYDLNQQRQDTLDRLMMQDSVGERADNSMEQMYALNGTTPNVIPESEPEPTFTPDSKATDFWNEGAERDFNIKQNLGKAKEFGSDAIDTAGGILGPIAKSWYGNLSKDAERGVAEYNTDESIQGLMGQNVKRNIAEMVKGGVDAAMSPVETADAIASLVSGTVQHALPDDMAWNEESKDMASAVADIYAERYGSLEGFKKALAENPAEVILELTGVGLVGKAGAAKLVSKLNNPDFLDKVESMSKAIDPTNLGPSSELTTFHGSPHKFEKFDHKYMGSGEGGQMMGWGTYLAEHPNVAKSYQARDMGMEDKLMKLYDDAGDYRKGTDDPVHLDVYERAMLHETPKEIADYINDTYDGDDLVRAKQAIDNYRKLYEGSDSYLYEIDLPDDTIAKMLDSDKTIMEQSDYVISVLDEIFPNLSKEIDNAKRIKKQLDTETNKSTKDKLFQEYADIKKRLGFNLDDNAHSLYRNLENTLGSDKKASQLLESKGIHGVKFLDQDSRFEGGGTSNFVIFNENSAKVLKRNEADIPNVDDGVLGQIGKTKNPTTDLRNSLREGGYKIDMDEGISGEIKLSRIEVPPNVRGKGLGSKAMEDIIKMADESGKTITLTPDTSFGATSVSRLKKFYKKFGFVENKGKNKDFLYKDSMLRLPNNAKATIPAGGLLGEDAINVEASEDEGEGLLGVKKKVEKPMNGVLDGIKKPKIVRNVRSNNPGNIKDFGIKWNGMTGTESGGTVAEGEFVVFDKPENGIRALTRDLTNKRKRGLDTITKILNKYAPNGKENDTKSYIKDVARDVGIGATDKLSDKNMYKMIKAITKHEGGKESLKHFTDAIIKKGMKSAYKNKYQKFK